MLRRALHITLFLTAILSLACTGSAQTTGSVTITGAETQTSGIWDLGTVTVTVNGYPVTVPYGQFSTPDSIASAIAAGFSCNCGGPANARSAPGGIINLRMKGGTPISPLTVTVSSSTSFGGTASVGASITPTTTVATIGSTLIASGSSTTVDVQVSCASACGNVYYQLDGGSWGTVALDSSGHFSASTGTGWSVGLHNIIIYYQGNDTYLPSTSNPVSFTITSGSTTFSPFYSYAISSYDPVGNIKHYTDTVNGTWGDSTNPMMYDNLNRLVGGNYTPVGSSEQYLCWSYDSFGNRAIQATSDLAFTVASPTCQRNSSGSILPFSVVASYSNVLNQIGSTNASGSTFSPVYDLAGNISNDNVNEYLYDDDGRICAVHNFVSGTKKQYLYDAEGNRVAKGTISTWSCDLGSNSFSETAAYVVGQNGEQISEVDGSGNWIHTNVYAGDNMIATYDGSGLNFHLNDFLGTRRVQTDYAGTIESTFPNMPFGEMVPNNNTVVLGATEQHFTGKERDSESGNDYFGARYYASSMGRWMSPDESLDGAIMELPQTWNKYSYEYNRPLYGTDPDGRCPPCFGALIGGVVEGGFDLGKQFIKNGYSLNIGKKGWEEVGANFVGGAVAGAIAGATGGASLIIDAAAGATGNIAGGIVTRSLDPNATEEPLSLGAVSGDALGGFVGGGVGHVAGEFVKIPDEPHFSMSGRNGRIYNQAYRQGLRDLKGRNTRAFVNQGLRAGVTASGVGHGIEAFWERWFLSGPHCHTEQTSTTMTDGNGNVVGTSIGTPRLVCN